jgi:hypothetical protein
MSDINQIWMYRQLLVQLLCMKFHENLFIGSQVCYMRTDRRTDMAEFASINNQRYVFILDAETPESIPVSGRVTVVRIASFR